ncbi:signal recognition particle-docking protein FtsY [Stygiolobus caldivivus]|uniref:Signal recognition particle receptor FtsY n=1 Tax=Stygiolobus caldivivus TaxID=2824673 RepID=A0A8D5U7K6_9CREN|nr:signal recognition particle-docking protein FtsY [Stygiolobus caldivivus]BCU70804.1 signal recognition particle-docking protein FtsY [Stygiolobus caldivivus]
MEAPRPAEVAQPTKVQQPEEKHANEQPKPLQPPQQLPQTAPPKTEEKPVEEQKKEEKPKSRFSFFDFLRYKTIKEEDITDLIEEFRYQLLEADVSYEVSEKILEDLKNSLVGKKVSRSEELEKIVLDSLKKSIEEILTKNRGFDLIEEIKQKGKKPYVIVFFGVNGVGKTTTIAKVAYMLKKQGLSSIIAASDTFRAAAQEQLAYHAQKLEVPLVKGKYGGDPAAVAFDAISSAKSRGIDVVLVDTAGRMHVDSDLVEELKRVVRISKPDLRVLVLDSLAGNDALEQAKYFENNVGYDAVILTKVDADAKGGIVLSLAYELKKPVIYLGIGQDYDNLIPFSPDWFIKRIFQ